MRDAASHIADLICAAQQVDPEAGVKGPTGHTFSLRDRIAAEVRAEFARVFSKQDVQMLRAAALSANDLPRVTNDPNVRHYASELHAFADRLAVLLPPGNP